MTAALRVARPAGLVLANDDDRFNTGMRPTSICVAESRPSAPYSRTVLERKAAEEARRPWRRLMRRGGDYQ
jgi:hypothetical protein